MVDMIRETPQPISWAERHAARPGASSGDDAGAAEGVPQNGAADAADLNGSGREAESAAGDATRPATNGHASVGVAAPPRLGGAIAALRRVFSGH
jgi:hypothetical protein